MPSVTGVGTTNDLASAIIKRFDEDGNGALSTNEFASFLTQLVSGLGQPGKDAAQAASPGGLSTLFPSAAAAVPASASTPRTRMGDMLGFSSEKLDDAGHVSFKYQVGRILQYYPSTKEGLQQALAEIQQLVPDAKIVGSNGDKIDFGAYADEKSGKIGVIDVLVGAAAGGRGWAWQPVE